MSQMMSHLTILDNIRIASPCPADWSEMIGDDRARFCSSCSKHVYNISAMTAQEATSLIVENEGRLCLRIYKRADGTVLTSDCPVGSAQNSANRRRGWKFVLGALLLPLLITGVAATGIGKRTIEPFPTGPGVTWNDRVNWALTTVGFRKPPRVPPAGTVITGDMY